MQGDSVCNAVPSLASHPYFSSCACAGERGRGKGRKNTLCIVGIAAGLLFHGSSSATWNLAGSLAVVASHAYAG